MLGYLVPCYQLLLLDTVLPISAVNTPPAPMVHTDSDMTPTKGGSLPRSGSSLVTSLLPSLPFQTTCD